MSSKPEQQSGSRRSRKLRRAAKEFFSGLPEQAMIDACAGLFIIVAVSMLLLRYQRPEITPLAAGAIAPSDIVAPDDLKAEDGDETSRRRLQAAAAIPPVFDFNSRAAREADNIIEEAFAAGRAAPARRDAPLSIDRIEQASGLVLDEEQFGVLDRHMFNSELEKLLIDHLDAVMMNGVVSGRSQLMKLGATGLTRRDTRAGQEYVVTDLSTVLDLITARAALRAEKVVWAFEYCPRGRRLFGGVLGLLIVTDFLPSD